MIIVVLTVLLIIGFHYEKVRRDADVNKHPPVGNILTYDNKKIHYIKNGQGQETVVFCSGNGTSSPYLDMYNLQEEVSPFTETIVYERPGYGWSDATTNERTIDNITNEMETVLEAATDNDTFIFVGHSIAALEIFYYAQKHPEKVKGIVLIDGVSPKYASQMENPVPMSIHVMKMLKSTGMLRLLSHIERVKSRLIQVENLPDELKDVGIDLTLQQMWNSTMIAERNKLMENGKNVNEGKRLADIPLVLFSATSNQMKGWKQSQEELASWSNHTKQIWIETDNHFIHHEHPNVIIQEIIALLKQKSKPKI